MVPGRPFFIATYQSNRRQLMMVAQNERRLGSA
jgi:hypothetical protein